MALADHAGQADFSLEKLDERPPELDGTPLPRTRPPRPSGPAREGKLRQEFWTRSSGSCRSASTGTD
jgi:hypothetical protein